jgi:predicted dehydrogenase
MKNCLIIGFGSIGKKHYKILKKINKFDKIFVVSKHIKKSFVFSSIEKLKNFKFSYIVVANNSNLHYSTLQKIEKFFFKTNVLIEKPLFTKIHKVKKNLKNNYFVGYNLRFNPIIDFIKKYSKNRRPINVDIRCHSYLPNWRPNADYRKSYSANKKKSGGIILDMSHELDYLQYLFGEIKSINTLEKKISKLPIKSSDYCTINGLTKKKIFFKIDISIFSRIWMRDLCINYENESLHADLIKKNILFVKGDQVIRKKFFFDPQNSYKKMHEAIINNKFQSLSKLQENVCLLKKVI